MLKLILSLVAATTLARCSIPLAQISAERGNAKIGDDCERDINCIENAYCRNQRSCFCDTYYAPSADKSICLATNGLTCAEDIICQTMSNAECRQGACACKETFILDINNSSNCVPRPSKVGDQCQRNDECQEVLDRALCIDEKCRCLTGHKFINQTGRCIQTRGIYQPCTSSDQCLLDDDTPDALECRNNECVCKEGDSRCNKGSLPLIATIVAAFSFLLPHVI